jgi:hypothetical protein
MADLVTKRDLQVACRQPLRRSRRRSTGLRGGGKIDNLSLRLPLRLGVMLAVAFGALAAILKLT